MKIRMRENSVRLRLSRKEVIALEQERRIQESVEFIEGTLTYSLEISSIPNLSAHFENGTIRVLIPVEMAKHWFSTDGISLHEVQGNLKILIEKDFACLNPHSVWQEDQSDCYPHPHPGDSCQR